MRAASCCRHRRLHSRRPGAEGLAAAPAAGGARACCGGVAARHDADDVVLPDQDVRLALQASRQTGDHSLTSKPHGSTIVTLSCPAQHRHARLSSTAVAPHLHLQLREPDAELGVQDGLAALQAERVRLGAHLAVAHRNHVAAGGPRLRRGACGRVACSRGRRHRQHQQQRASLACSPPPKPCLAHLCGAGQQDAAARLLLRLCHLCQHEVALGHHLQVSLGVCAWKLTRRQLHKLRLDPAVRPPQAAAAGGER